MDNGDVIYAVRRDDETYSYTLTTIDGDLVDLTDGKAWFTVKATNEETEEDTAALIQKEIDSFTNPTLGVIYIDLTNEDTDLDPGIYWYDLQFRDSRDKYTTKIGKFIVVQDITQKKT